MNLENQSNSIRLNSSQHSVRSTIKPHPRTLWRDPRSSEGKAIGISSSWESQSAFVQLISVQLISRSLVGCRQISHFHVAQPNHFHIVQSLRCLFLLEPLSFVHLQKNLQLQSSNSAWITLNSSAFTAVNNQWIRNIRCSYSLCIIPQFIYLQVVVRSFSSQRASSALQRYIPCHSEHSVPTFIFTRDHSLHGHSFATLLFIPIPDSQHTNLYKPNPITEHLNVIFPLF